ncbi:MAG: alpha/beta fold hydrolase [Congregibacter sp.]
MRQKLEFESQGLALSGALEMPDTAPRCFAVFAHCFTCGKDIAAASRVSRALNAAGIAVLRFDFTGLGNSDGDFSNTNFSSNVQDLVAAADFLREHYTAPKLLIGHSLGGAATLVAAASVPEATAIVTIGAPYSAQHVMHNFQGSVEAIERDGQAQVTLGSREFTIQKQFLDDIRAQSDAELGSLRKALLVMHAPGDNTVSISEAENIYRAARHPKSFISLDDADHLLSRRDDSEYVAATIAAWASRYLPAPISAERPTVEKGHIRVEEQDHKFTQRVLSDSHSWLADEPRSLGGKDRGPDPYEHLLAALGTCTAMTLRMYADRKQLALEHVAVELRHSREHQKDCADCEDTGGQIDVLTRTVQLDGDLSDSERRRLLEIADRCPVHRTLHGPLAVETELAS